MSGDFCSVCGSGVAVREDAAAGDGPPDSVGPPTRCRLCRVSIIVGRDCPICGFQIRPGDALAEIERGRADGGGWAHFACTREGVKRWCREGRPLETTARRWDRHPPLMAARVLGWAWHDRPGDARRTHVPPVAQTADTLANAATTSGP